MRFVHLLRPTRRQALVGATVMTAVASVAGAAVAATNATTTSTTGARTSGPATTVAAPSGDVLKDAKVTTGNLSVSKRVDGTAEVVGSVAVLHRVEPSAATPVSTATGGATSGSTATGGAAAAAAPAATPSSTAPAAATTTTTACPSPTTRPVTTTTTTVDSTTTTTGATTTTTGATTTTTVVGNAAVETTTTAAATTTTTARAGTTTTTGLSAQGGTTTTLEVTTTTGTPPVTTTAGCSPTTTEPTRGAPPTAATTTAPATTAAPAPNGTAGATRSAAATAAAAPGGASAGGASARVTQLVTGVAAVGTPIGIGDVLYSVESRPVVALSGSLPAWRTLEVGVADGTDVLQLEQSLAALGYAPDGSLELDGHFDAETAQAVERWQTGLGLEATGTVTLGSVVFLHGPATVLTHSTAVGHEIADGDAVLTLSGTSQRVLVTVPDELRAAVTPGLEVDLAGKKGTVTRLRSAGSDGAVVVQAVVTPNAALAVDDGATVKVTFSVTTLADQLTVPADALVSRIDGTYAVQLPDADGRHRFVTVEMLAVGNGQVAVRSDGLHAGDTIRIPA